VSVVDLSNVLFDYKLSFSILFWVELDRYESLKWSGVAIGSFLLLIVPSILCIRLSKFMLWSGLCICAEDCSYALLLNIFLIFSSLMSITCIFLITEPSYSWNKGNSLTSDKSWGYLPILFFNLRFLYPNILKMYSVLSRCPISTLKCRGVLSLMSLDM